MPDSIDDLIPNATQIRKEAALKEAEKADEYARTAAAADAEKHALIERLSQPSGKTEAEKIKLASTIIQRAVRNGMTEVWSTGSRIRCARTRAALSIRWKRAGRTR